MSDLASVTYTGPMPQVEVPLPDGQIAVCVQGQPVNLPRALAAEMVARGEWLAAGPAENHSPRKPKTEH
jgi:hypothetical protein